MQHCVCLCWCTVNLCLKRCALARKHVVLASTIIQKSCARPLTSTPQRSTLTHTHMRTRARKPISRLFFHIRARAQRRFSAFQQTVIPLYSYTLLCVCVCVVCVLSACYTCVLCERARQRARARAATRARYCADRATGPRSARTIASQLTFNSCSTSTTVAPSSIRRVDPLVPPRVCVCVCARSKASACARVN